MRLWQRHITLIVLAAMPFFGLSPIGTAEELPSAGADYSIDVWTSDDGLPQNSVISMAQTTDGYIWLSTFAGIARFDGKHFEVFDGDVVPALAGDIFTSLRADTSGNLWLRGERKSVMVGRNGRFRKLGDAEGLPPTGASGLDSGVDGNIWIGDDSGRVLKFDAKQGRFVVVQETPPTTNWGRIDFLQVEPSGVVWTWRHGTLARLEDGRWTIILRNGKGGDLATARALSRGGVITSWYRPDQLLEYTGEKASDLGSLPAGFGIYFVQDDVAGNLWFAGQTGVFRRTPDGRFSALTPKDGLPTDQIRSVLRDQEGNLWFGTDGGGLIRVKRRVAGSIGVPQGLSKKVTLSLTPDGANGIWVTALGGNVDHFQGGFFTEPLMAGDLPWCVCHTHEGDIWVGTYTDGLFLKKPGETNLSHFTSTTSPGMLGGPITALFESSRGDLWMGGEYNTLSRYSGGGFRSWTAATGLAEGTVDAIGEDHDGTIWVGAEGGLNKLAGDSIKKFSVADGLAGNAVRAIFCDSQGTLWLGGHELTRLENGQFRAIRSKDGLPIYSIKAMIEDDLGNLWFSTPHGILRSSLSQLNRFCDTGKGQVEFSVFTKADGLPSDECSGNQPAACKSSDGRLWFPTLNGLAVIDPKHLPQNKVRPPVAIESGWADDKPLQMPDPGAESSPVEVAAGTLRVEFRFAALSFTAPEKNRFRYKLEGFDTSWTEPGTAQTANYNRLPPDTYHFHVRASNNDGVWNETGAILAVKVLPLFWQTGLFRMLVIAAAVGVIYGIFLSRLRQVERRRLIQESFARQVIETQEAERQRIAQELHDGVGQSLILAKNRLGLSMRKVEAASPILEHLSQATADVTQAIEEIRTTARALCPPELDRLGLGQALESMIERTSATTTTRFSSELDDIGGAIGREVEIQLYRIAQEAVNNVLKHSKANEVIVELKKDADKIRLTVHDDGVGFDPASAGGTAGLGLSGMAERARLVGGALSVKTAPGKGCRLTVTVNLRK